jgi:hypothetical protein
MELNGRLISINSLEVDGVDTKDYPDFSDAYFSYGEYEDGQRLTDDELEQATKAYPEVVNEVVHESLH